MTKRQRPGVTPLLVPDNYTNTVTRFRRKLPLPSPSARQKPKRNAERTRKLILRAATAEFANKGFDGGRIDEIARRSGVNKNLIYYYFGSKDRLIIAVMERIYEDMRARQNDLSVVGLEPEAGMRALVEHSFDHFASTPELLTLMSNENLHRAEHIRKSRKIRSLYNPLMTALRSLLERGAAQEIFRTDVDAVDLYISITGLSYFYLANRFTLGFIFGQNLVTPNRLRQRRKHVATLVLDYLKNRAPKS